MLVSLVTLFKGSGVWSCLNAENAFKNIFQHLKVVRFFWKAQTTHFNRESSKVFVQQNFFPGNNPGGLLITCIQQKVATLKIKVDSYMYFVK